MKVKEVEIVKEVIRSDGWWRFACGDVYINGSIQTQTYFTTNWNIDKGPQSVANQEEFIEDFLVENFLWILAGALQAM